MLRTEEEAKKCWCPFARVPTFDVHDIGGAAAASSNRSDMSTQPGFAPCLASECMAWRPVDARGFCGLAGRPT